MCGIAGIVSLGRRPVAVEEVRALCAALTHRGPDEEGIWAGDGAALGMRRLSIIDVAGGSQPLASEDGGVQVVCNGEIYDHRALRDLLERRGHCFATASDTESIAHAYEEWDANCVTQLRGMFALAVWDRRRRRLLLARDRLGIKPLFYTVSGDRLIFASELKAILRLGEVERRLSWKALAHYLTFLSTPAADSIVEGVRKLEPGHLLLASADRGVQVEPYWSLRFEPGPERDEAVLAESLRGRLEESVRLHLESDVPVGAFLSGGLDSSAVVATMARLAGGPVRTFSIGFEEKEYDELAHARSVARKFGTEHHELVVRPKDLDLMDRLAWALDEPFGDTSAIPTYLVSRLAAGSVKVVLSGDGGDELFAGYDKYVVEERERRREPYLRPFRGLLERAARLMPEGMRGRNLVRHSALAGAARYLDASTLFPEAALRRLLRPEARERLAPFDPAREAWRGLEGAGGHWLSALQAHDLKTYLPLDVLTKVDRMSMAHGLEVRVPLLDHPLVEFAATLPPESGLRGGVTKRLFKRALRGVLPDAIIDRPKHGFAVPFGRWLRGPLKDDLRDLLLSERCRDRGVFEPAAVEALLERHDHGRDLDLHLWTLCSFELWCRTFLDAAPAASAREAS